MNVYFIVAYGEYSVGTAVVVADTVAEAQALGHGIPQLGWDIKYHAPEIVEQLPITCEGPARVLAHYEDGE